MYKLREKYLVGREMMNVKGRVLVRNSYFVNGFGGMWNMLRDESIYLIW